MRRAAVTVKLCSAMAGVAINASAIVGTKILAKVLLRIAASPKRAFTYGAIIFLYFPSTFHNRGQTVDVNHQRDNK